MCLCVGERQREILVVVVRAVLALRRPATFSILLVGRDIVL